MKCAIAIKELRRKLKKSDRFEFKFNKADKKIRLAFLKKVSSFKFRVRAIVFLKEKIRSWELKTSKQSFYSFAVKSVLKYSFGRITDAKIRLDGHGDRVYRKEMVKYLRKQLNTPENRIFKKLKFVNSKTNVLIQLADMVAGSILRFQNKSKKDYRNYYDILKNSGRIEDVWYFK